MTNQRKNNLTRPAGVSTPSQAVLIKRMRNQLKKLKKRPVNIPIRPAGVLTLREAALILRMTTQLTRYHARCGHLGACDRIARFWLLLDRKAVEEFVPENPGRQRRRKK